MKSKEECSKLLQQVFDHYSDCDIADEERKELWEVHSTIEALLNRELPSRKYKLVLGYLGGKEIEVEVAEEPTKDKIIEIIEFYNADNYRIASTYL